MNGRRAKAMRRAAEAHTTGAPLVEYQPEKRIHKQHPVLDAAEPGGIRYIHYTVPTERHLAPGCTRAAYQSLKRGRPTKVLEFVGSRTKREQQRVEEENPTLALEAAGA